MGAFSMVIVENMDMKDVQKLEEKFSEVEHVKDVLWYDDVADITLPVEMVPEKYRKGIYKWRCNHDAWFCLIIPHLQILPWKLSQNYVRLPTSSASSVA